MERAIVEAAAKSVSSSSYVCPICKKLKLKGRALIDLDLFYFFYLTN